jgi:hypothetical protein
MLRDTASKHHLHKHHIKTTEFSQLTVSAPRQKRLLGTNKMMVNKQQNIFRKTCLEYLVMYAGLDMLELKQQCTVSSERLVRKATSSLCFTATDCDTPA